MRIAFSTLIISGAAVPAAAAELAVNVEIPRLNVAEYHPPYVAMWIEKPDQTAVRTLSVWYDVKLKKQEGETWLKDMRTWWRKAGRELDLPLDGVSGATRAPGKHQAVFGGGKLAGLQPGTYNLVVEAAREVGGREVVRVPFEWPAKGARSGSTRGQAELGAVSLTLKP